MFIPGPEESINQKLCWASSGNNFTAVKELVSRGADFKTFRDPSVRFEDLKAIDKKDSSLSNSYVL